MYSDLCAGQLIGFVNILKVCRHNKVGHLLYASSSSVYGVNEKLPFSVEVLIDISAALKTVEGKPPYKIYNVGNNRPEKLMDFIKIIEEYFGKHALLELLPLQPGDVLATYADIRGLKQNAGVKPETSLRDGLAKFVD